MFVLTLNNKTSGKILRNVITVCFILAAALAVKNFVFGKRQTVAVVKQNFEMNTTQQMIVPAVRF